METDTKQVSELSLRTEITYAHHMIDGDLEITEDGTKIVDSIVNGSITVSAKDCTLLQNSIFGDVFAQSDTVIEDCTIEGKTEILQG